MIYVASSVAKMVISRNPYMNDSGFDPQVMLERAL